MTFLWLTLIESSLFKCIRQWWRHRSICIRTSDWSWFSVSLGWSWTLLWFCVLWWRMWRWMWQVWTWAARWHLKTCRIYQSLVTLSDQVTSVSHTETHTQLTHIPTTHPNPSFKKKKKARNWWVQEILIEKKR